MPSEGDYSYARYFTPRERKTMRAQRVKELLRQGWTYERAKREVKRAE